MHTFKANENDAKLKLVNFLEKAFRDVPHSALRKAMRNKDVKINGKRIKDPNYIISIGDEIIVYGLETKDNEKFQKAKVMFHVVYEDNNILVTSKPVNTVMHGEDNCMDNQVKTYLSNNGFDLDQATFVPSHCHRLDKLTSGIVVYAKTAIALKQINDAFKNRNVEKEYILKIQGNHELNLNCKGFIDYYNGHGNFELKSSDMNKQCETKLTTLDFDNDTTVIKAEPKTGRKHQIRITLAHLGHPIIGDQKYGSNIRSRLMLHSRAIKFNNLNGDLEYLNGKIFIREAEW